MIEFLFQRHIAHINSNLRQYINSAESREIARTIVRGTFIKQQAIQFLAGNEHF